MVTTTLIAVIIVIIALIYLQIKLSRMQNKFYGLILPTLVLLVFIMVLIILTPLELIGSNTTNTIIKLKPQGIMLHIIALSIPFAIPFIIFTFIYISERNKIKNKEAENLKIKDIEKMKIKDL